MLICFVNPQIKKSSRNTEVDGKRKKQAQGSMGVLPMQTPISSSKGLSSLFSPPYFINPRSRKSLLAPSRIPKYLKFTRRGKKCRLSKQVDPSLSAFFSIYSAFFWIKILGTGFAPILSAVKRPMDWVTTNKSL